MKTAFFVTMTDKFMSGWGMAKGKINKLIIECETLQQAEQIERAARKRSEMRYVNIRTTKPRYGSNVLESWKCWQDLGEVWTGGLK
jgi:hypothetical protein